VWSQSVRCATSAKQRRWRRGARTSLWINGAAVGRHQSSETLQNGNDAIPTCGLHKGVGVGKAAAGIRVV
jgi:hypothetical protein